MERFGDVPRLLGGIDMRHHDAQRAVVQRARGLIDGIGAGPHDRRDAGRQRRDAKFGDLVHGKRAMLVVDEQPVMAGARRQHRRRRTAQMVHAEAERDLAGRHAAFGGVLHQ